jgi:DNA-binding PadR family transcriptional regulator
MKLLSRTEEMILLSVFTLGEKAYGLAIRGHLNEVSGKRFSVGAVYVPLERLEDKGMLLSHEAEPTPERGGRSKRYYRLTAKGKEALEEIRVLHAALWKGYASSEEAQSFAVSALPGNGFL